MIGLDAESANKRMSKMEYLLSSVRIEGVNQRLTIRVSHAFEDFDDLSNLEATITRADAGMYRQKEIRKGLNAHEPAVPPEAVNESEVLVGK